MHMQRTSNAHATHGQQQHATHMQGTGTGAGTGRGRKRKNAADAAPTRTEEADLFHRGKEVLGDSAGGLIKNLIKAKAGNIALARAAIETASTKQDPREYIAACIRGSEAGAQRANGWDPVPPIWLTLARGPRRCETPAPCLLRLTSRCCPSSTTRGASQLGFLPAGLIAPLNCGFSPAAEDHGRKSDPEIFKHGFQVVLNGSTRPCNSPLLGLRDGPSRGDVQGHAVPSGRLRGASRTRVCDPGPEENHLPVLQGEGQGEERERTDKMTRWPQPSASRAA
jgi:hypothetical protein